MPTIPLTLFSSPPGAESSGRLRTVPQRVSDQSTQIAEERFATSQEMVRRGELTASMGKKLIDVQNARNDARAQLVAASERLESDAIENAARDDFNQRVQAIEQQRIDDPDARARLVDDAFRKSRKTIEERARLLSPNAQRRLYNNLEAYRISTQTGQFQGAMSDKRDNTRAAVIRNAETSVRQMFQSDDPAIRSQIAVSYLNSLSALSGTILPADEVEKYRAKFLDRVRNEATTEFSRLPLPQVFQIVANAKDMTPTEGNDLIAKSAAWNNRLYEIDQREEAAREKAIAKAQELNAARIAAEYTSAIVQRNPGRINQLLAVTETAVERGMINGDRARVLFNLGRTALTSPESVTDDAKTVASLLQDRLIGLDVGHKSVAALRAGLIKPSTASGFVDDALDARNANRYFNLDVYKQHLRAIPKQAATFSRFVALGAQFLPNIRNELEAVEGEMVLAFETDVREFAERNLGNTALIRDQVPIIYQNTIARYRPIVQGIATSARPRTDTIDHALALFNRGELTEQRLAEEYVLHALSGNIPRESLSPRGQELYDKLIEAYRHDITRSGETRIRDEQ